MNEQELARKVVQHLDRGLDHFQQGTRYKLQQARMAALDRYRATPERAVGFGWAGSFSTVIGDNRHLRASKLLTLGLLLLSLLSLAYWQVSTRGNDFAEIDASLLSGDLPIDAYLDRDFEAWLKRPSQ